MLLLSRNERYLMLLLIVLGAASVILGFVIIDIGPQGIISRVLGMAGGALIGVPASILALDVFEKIYR